MAALHRDVVERYFGTVFVSLLLHRGLATLDLIAFLSRFFFNWKKAHRA